jgi:hypothetical protein
MQPRSQQCHHDRVHEPEQRFRWPSVLDWGASHAPTFPDRIMRRKGRQRPGRESAY